MLLSLCPNLKNIKITDGFLIKNNDFFKKNNPLQIVLFQDAFEVCNPLGSSKCKFKLVGVYMIIANLPAYLRSKIEHIQLVLLCYEKHITFFGWDKVMEVLVDDLRKLEKDGIKICINNEITTINGTVIATVGDNLGSHQLGGFTENFSSSEYICRYCDVHKSQFKNVCTKVTRNPQNYDVSANEAEYKCIPTNGIKNNSCLNKLKYFHVCNPGLPPCIAHDLLEGIIPYDFMYCIKYFVKNQWFNFNLLNSRLKKIKFFNEKSIVTIPPIKDACKLTGNASQIKRLLLIFPIAICDLVIDTEDDVWRLILCLREKTFLILASALSFGQIALIQEKINEYLSLRLKCFPKIKLRPKHHYITHYPSLILHFSPLKHFWTLRFESKHKYFKNIVKHTQNFKNITKTLCQKHQYLQALRYKDLYRDKAISDNAEIYSIANFPTNISSVITTYFYDNKEQNFKYVASEVLFRGIMYKAKTYVCVGKDSYDNLLLYDIFILNLDS
ncbi:uncharacterized protein [Prorops nasuta]|uniref:uncharacterized protein n=1 Tax=Prorops nasuta TaxID=863751 RepID=UPI0034CE90EF